MTAARKLRQMLEREGLIRALAPHDVFSGLIMEQAGIELLFLGGFGVAASSFGLPDIGLLTLTEMSQTLARFTDRIHLPIVIDGDTGHGGLANISRTVREFERNGAAGMLIEDQTFPKRCGHFTGKQVVSTQEMVDRLKSALDARRDADFVIFARTDARAVEGLDAAIDRARRYGEAGADVCFVEAPLSTDELARVAKEIPQPQLANMLLGGLTPILTCGELERLGFKIAVDPVTSLAVTGRAIRSMTSDWILEGRIDILLGDRLSLDDIKQVLGMS